MLRHKLLQVLSQLSRKEMTRFREFVYSPYHNKHEEVRALVDNLSENHPRFLEGRTCQRRNLFQNLFPGEKHNQGKLAILFTYAYRLWEEFISLEVAKNQPGGQSVFLLSHLRERGANSPLFEQSLRKVENALEDSPFRDSRYHLWSYQTAREADLFYSQQGKFGKDNSLQIKQDHLDRYLLSEKLKDGCEMTIRKKILRVEYQTTLLEPVLEEVRGNWAIYGEVPSVAVYYQIYLLLNGAHERYFEVVRNLEANEGFFPLEERQLLYHYLQNYCIERINQGRSEFLAHSFQLYQLQLEKSLLFLNGFLPEAHYKNLVTIGLRLQENKWVQDFIHSFRNHLHPGVAENAFSFNLASYYYATGQLDKVQELLLRVEYTDLRYNLGAKALLLRTYYDLEEDEALLSLFDSFEQYLKRSQLLADERVQSFRRLLRFTRRAMVLRARQDFVSNAKTRQGIEALWDQVQRTDPIINKEWLVEKVEKLKS
ncbi:MAG: hypothetical protein IPG32_18350 [Saprospirales bacterium]|nr:hypothetical protein [Saprospirales bacterium]